MKVFNRRNIEPNSNLQVTPVSTVPVVIDVLVSVVHAEGLIDGGALVHEIDGASGVGRYVADGEQSVERDGVQEVRATG